MDTIAVVMSRPGQLETSRVELTPPTDADVVVDMLFTGISTGTERLLYTGRMPDFPGLGYPLVPGYEAVGRVAEAGPGSQRSAGDLVFVPGATCFKDARGLFGGAAHRVVVPGPRTIALPESMSQTGVLLALAATAHHALAGHAPPDLIIGNGVLGRLLARITIALGHDAPTVWETNPIRRDGADGYSVLDPDADDRRDYRAIYDVSGDSAIIDTLVTRLAKGGEIVLAGFYADRLTFAFPPAFMREARLRIAAQWGPDSIAAVMSLAGDDRLDLSGLVTDERPANDARAAYETAFDDPACLKMVLDWRNVSQ